MPVNKQAKTGVYYKMHKNNSSFKAGETGNPNGRPKGAKSSSTREWAKMRKLAVDDYHEAYKELREHMKVGEGWAHNIFFKELVPKKIYTDTILIDLLDNTPEARVAAITTALSQYDELTHDEAMKELTVFSKIKLAENIGKQVKNLLPFLNNKESEAVHKIFADVEERILSGGEELI